jgi:hydrogenase large subunit
VYYIAYSAAMALFFVEKAMEEIRAGHTRTFTDFKVPEEALGVGFHEAVRGVLSHHLVIRDGKIANYHPYPPTCWNASPTDSEGVAGPMEDAIINSPIFEENGRDNFKGIDILRTVRSLDPCLPCGVHMYLGGGREIRESHIPIMGLNGRVKK